VNQIPKAHQRKVYIKQSSYEQQDESIVIKRRGAPRYRQDVEYYEEPLRSHRNKKYIRPGGNSEVSSVL
jgi:hypothetical protein